MNGHAWFGSIPSTGGRTSSAPAPEEFKHSPNRFRMAALVTVLQRHLGVHYYLPFNEGDYNATDSRNLFIHGVLNGHGGTCVTMPVLYVAIGRRLGYPLKLVEAYQHLFVRWDEAGGERFNIECTCPGFRAWTPITSSNGRYRFPRR